MPPGDGVGPVRGRLLLLLMVAAGGVGVAIGATDLDLLLPPSEREGLGTLRIVGAAVAVAGLAALLLQRGRIRSDARTLVTAAGIMAALVFVAAMAPHLALDFEPEPVAAPEDSTFVEPTGPRLTGELAGRGGVLATGEADGPRRPMVAREVERQATEEPARFDRDFMGPALNVLIVLLLLGAFLWALRLARRTPPDRRGLEWSLEDPADRDAPMTAAGVAALAQAAEELHGESARARSEVTASYHRFLEALAGAGPGWARRPHEAPFEHLNRVLEALRIQADPPAKLVELHVAAEFGTRSVTEAERRLAEDALREALHDLEGEATP